MAAAGKYFACGFAASIFANQKIEQKLYKFVERLAWITGSLSVAGVILILFLQGIEKTHVKSFAENRKRPALKYTALRPRPISKRTEQPAIVKVEPPKPEPEIRELKKEEPKPKETRIIETREPTPQPKPREGERLAVRRQETLPENVQPDNSGRLFADSELNQLVGKIQAEKIRYNSTTNCIQLRITADNNNAQAVSQVERFLASKNYIITGREKEDFLRGTGLKVYAQGNCLKVTVGRKT